MNIFYDILDKNRLDILSLFKQFKNQFYLAGGTGLALQLGHRDSVDFDFFTPDHFDTVTFYTDLLNIFNGRKITKTLEDKDSLNILIDKDIKLSFLRYPYILLNVYIDEKNLKIASLEDIACMKLSAIVSRATWKDYVDIYFILKKISLGLLLEKINKKMPDLDQNLILKSVVYFNDIVDEPIMFKHGFNVSHREVEKFLVDRVRELNTLKQ